MAGIGGVWEWKSRDTKGRIKGMSSRTSSRTPSQLGFFLRVDLFVRGSYPNRAEFLSERAILVDVHVRDMLGRAVQACARKLCDEFELLTPEGRWEAETFGQDTCGAAQDGARTF